MVEVSGSNLIRFINAARSIYALENLKHAMVIFIVWNSYLWIIFHEKYILGRFNCYCYLLVPLAYIAFQTKFTMNITRNNPKLHLVGVWLRGPFHQIVFHQNFNKWGISYHPQLNFDSDHYKVFHMTRQLCCHSMFKGSLWCGKQEWNYAKTDFHIIRIMVETISGLISSYVKG